MQFVPICYVAIISDDADVFIVQVFYARSKRRLAEKCSSFYARCELMMSK